MISLHTHSNYSLLRGTIPIQHLIDKSVQWGNHAVALTDLNGMYGLVQFADIAKKNKIKPILGTVLDDPDDSNKQLIILAKNNKGYSQICKLITTRKLKDDFTLSDVFHQDLENIFLITSSIELLKEVPDVILQHSNVFAEIIISEKQKRSTRKLYDFAKQKNIKICASNPQYIATKEDHLLHKVVTAIRTKSTLSNLDENEIVDEEFYLKSPEELHRLFAKLPEAIRNTNYITENCNVDLKIGEYKFPNFTLPAGETAYSYLWKICFKGLEMRYQPISDKAMKRLQYELEVIDELGFCDYFSDCLGYC
jgi:DNA polymerase III alpha subunit